MVVCKRSVAQEPGGHQQSVDHLTIPYSVHHLFDYLVDYMLKTEWSTSQSAEVVV